MLDSIRPILQKKTRLVAGIMSGTSLDGIDVALSSIRGCGKQTNITLRGFFTLPFDPGEREALLRLCSAETGTVSEVCRMNKVLGRRIGEAVLAALKRFEVSPEELDFVSSHGQTIQHMPEAGATLQIGELAEIAAVTGRPVVGDFRPSDMAYGGEGAPFVPFVDALLFSSNEKSRLLINIGGIANITALPRGGDMNRLTAYDTGPGNVLIDNLMKLSSGGRLTFDEGGKTALSGTVSEPFLDLLIREDSFLSRPAPKSTGREHYSLARAEKILAQGRSLGLSFPDILATVTDFTAFALSDSLGRCVPFSLDEFYVSGGGVHNAFLMSRLRTRLSGPLEPFEALGLPSDAKEAVAFAVLGNEFLEGSANNAPRATGADRPVIMGKLALPSPEAKQ